VAVAAFTQPMARAVVALVVAELVQVAVEEVEEVLEQ
jgi:hypothetical protein